MKLGIAARVSMPSRPGPPRCVHRHGIHRVAPSTETAYAPTHPHPQLNALHNAYARTHPQLCPSPLYQARPQVLPTSLLCVGAESFWRTDTSKMGTCCGKEARQRRKYLRSFRALPKQTPDERSAQLRQLAASLDASKVFRAAKYHGRT